VIPLLHHEQMVTNVRFSGAFCIDPLDRIDTRLPDFSILADCHPLECVEISIIRPRGLAVPRESIVGIAGVSRNLVM